MAASRRNGFVDVEADVHVYVEADAGENVDMDVDANAAFVLAAAVVAHVGDGVTKVAAVAAVAVQTK
jgi:hypothetical protein